MTAGRHGFFIPRVTRRASDRAENTRLRGLARPLRRMALLLALPYGGALLLKLAGSEVIFSRQMLINGLSSGAVYGAIALALVLTYQTTGVINIAIGETSTLGAFLAWSLVVDAGLPFWPGFLLAVGASALLGGLVERTIIRPLLRRGVLAMVVASAGLYAAVRNMDSIIYRDYARPFPTPFGQRVFHIAGIYLDAPRLGTLAVVCLAVGALGWLVQGTRLGLGLRAAAQQPAMATLCGVPVDRMLLLGWAISSALGAVAGILIANVALLEPAMLSGALIYALAAAALGGLDRPAGALAGGVLIGLIDVLLGSSIIFKDIRLPSVTLVLLVGLVVWPRGILGRRHARNV